MRVSVIVPVYNGAAYLAETLASIAAQSVPPHELIVVDDGSTDDSEAVARRSGVVTRFHRNAGNRGVCHSRNVGVALSTGELVAFCDQDDLWTPDKLACQVAAMAAHADVDVVFANFLHRRGEVTDGGDKFAQAPAGWWQGAQEEVRDGVIVLRRPALPSLLLFQPVFPSTMMVRRGLFERAGAFDEAMGREQSEDLEFLLRCDLVCRIAAVAAPLAVIRKHGANYSSDTTATTLSQIRILRAMLERDRRLEPFRALVEEQIVGRSMDAFDGAFAAGDLATCRALAPAIPRARRGLKLRVKAAVAGLPAPAARALRAVLVRRGPAG